VAYKKKVVWLVIDALISNKMRCSEGKVTSSNRVGCATYARLRPLTLRCDTVRSASSRPPTKRRPSVDETDNYISAGALCIPIFGLRLSPRTSETRQSYYD